MPTATPLDEGSTSATTAWLTLPINADEGLPQSFLVAIGPSTYRVELYVDVAEHVLPPWPADPRTLIDVLGDRPDIAAKGLLVATVVRQDPSRDVPLFRRRLLPGVGYVLADLWLQVTDAVVALGNLNAAGSFGSRLTVRVAPRVVLP